MRITNKKVIEQMKKLIKERMCDNDIKRYVREFKYKYDYNIFMYGNLDCYDYDLFKRLKEFGVDTKAVTNYEKVLYGGCTYKHREDIRNTYKTLVRKATQELIEELNS